MAGSNMVKYGSYAVEEADKELKQIETGSAEFMKLEVGKNTVRILPPAPGQKTPFRVVWTHYINPPGQSTPVSFACARLEAHKPCVICQTADRLKASGNAADYAKADQMFARRRIYCNVIDRTNEDAGPMILAFGKMIHEELILVRKAEGAFEDMGGDFTHPVKGFDIVIERRGTGKNDTKYRVMPRRQSVLHDDVNQAQEWLDNQHDLERYAKVLTPEEQKAKLSGTGVTAASDGGSSAGQRRQPRAPSVADSVTDVEKDGEEEPWA
jgi:hypothetical protein